MIAALIRPHGITQSPETAARAIAARQQQTPTEAVREFKGLTQLDLARRSGVTLGTIIALENGEPRHALADSRRRHARGAQEFARAVSINARRSNRKAF